MKARLIYELKKLWCVITGFGHDWEQWGASSWYGRIRNCKRDCGACEAKRARYDENGIEINE